MASRDYQKDDDGVAPTLVVGRAGNRASGRCVLRDRVKPLAFDVVRVTTDVGATVIGGGARHVAIVLRAAVSARRTQSDILLNYCRRRRVLCVLAF